MTSCYPFTLPRVILIVFKKTTGRLLFFTKLYITMETMTMETHYDVMLSLHFTESHPYCLQKTTTPALFFTKLNVTMETTFLDT